MQPILFYKQNMFNLKLENLYRILLVDITVSFIDKCSYFKAFLILPCFVNIFAPMKNANQEALSSALVSKISFLSR